MVDKFEGLGEQFFSFFIKVLIPALVGIALRIAMTMEKEKITFFKVVLSFISGISFVYLLQYPVKSLVHESWQPLVISLIAMSGESIGRFLITKFNLDTILKSCINYIVELIGNLLGMGRVFKNLLSTLIGSGLIYAGVYFEFSDIIRAFLILTGIILVFSKDTLFSRFGNIIDSLTGFFTKK